MAKIVDSEVDSQVISQSYSFWQNIFLGILLGAVYWGLMSIINKYTNLISLSSILSRVHAKPRAI